MPVTLRDIAERTGVSPSVVSTVLSGRQNGTFVSKDTRQRVLDVARQLNYVPVRSGRPRGSRRLRSQHAEQFIGVWCAGSDPHAYYVLSELQRLLAEPDESEEPDSGASGPGLRLVADADLPRLDCLGLTGLAIVGDMSLPRDAAAASLPCAQIGEPDHALRDSLVLHLDSFSAGQALGEHLWELGHRTLAFVAPASKPRVTRHRWQGLQSVWVDRGAPHSACVPAPYDAEKAAGTLREQADAAVRRLYSGAARQGPTAVICFDEAVTAYVLQALRKLGKDAPHDVSVACFGDSPGGADAMSPPVTTIRIPVATMLRAALDQLVSRRDADAAAAGRAADARRELRFAGELIVRESCGPVRAARPVSA